MKEQFGCVVALRSPAHITLIPPFWFEALKEPELTATLQSFRTNMDAIHIQIDGFSHFGKRVLFAAVRNDPALERLKNEVEAHFIKRFPDIKKEERAFQPHITIANRDLNPGDFIKAWQHFSGITFSQEFKTNVVSILKYTKGAWKVIAEHK